MIDLGTTPPYERTVRRNTTRLPIPIYNRAMPERRITLRTLLCMLLLTLAACGQKGQLYLPVEPPVQESVGAAEAPDATAEEEKNDNKGEAPR